MTTPDNREVIDRLAAEYALGTLRGPARRRFERWRASTPFVDERCRFWEERLMYLAKDLEPVQPPARVWPAIQRRLNLTNRSSPWRRIRAFALVNHSLDTQVHVTRRVGRLARSVGMRVRLG